MNQDFYDQLNVMIKEKRTFAIASVIEVIGSASAKPGSKAIVSSEGKNRVGWVGGGCAESFIVKQAKEAIKEKKPRLIEVDLDDEIFGIGMPCGGHMRVFVEPIFAKIKVGVDESTKEVTKFLLEEAGFETWTEDYDLKYENSDNQSNNLKQSEQAILDLASFLAKSRQANLESLSVVKNRNTFPCLNNRKLLLIGHSQISQHLARFAAMCEWPCRVVAPVLENYPNQVKLETKAYHEVEIESDELVVIASHHKGDLECLEQALRKGCQYVGLVASRSRSELVFGRLPKDCHGLENSFVSAPAGLATKGEGPYEIALSIFAELCQKLS